MAVDNPDFSGFVGLPGLPAAFSVCDDGPGRQAAPDLGDDLWEPQAGGLS
jgi:hypothetical protein